MLSSRRQVGLGGRTRPVALLGDALPLPRRRADRTSAPRTPAAELPRGCPAQASSSLGGDDTKLYRARSGSRAGGAWSSYVTRDALPLDRLRDAVRAVREHPVHARGEGRRLPVHASSAARAASPTLPGAAGDLVFYLFRDSPQRRAALALGARYALYGMDELAQRGWAVHSQPGVGCTRPGASPARWRSAAASRRRLRDRPRVAPRGEPCRRGPLRPSTPWGSR